MDQRAQIELTGRLEHGESLIWTGVPRQGLVLRVFDLFLIPFSLLWGGGAIFWEATVLLQGAPLVAALWGIPFVLMGLYLIIGRFFVDARIRANTFYGLTDRRAVILSGIFSRTVTSLPLRTLSDISVVERRDGSGTIHLGRPQPFAGKQWPGMGTYQTPSFDLIGDVQSVYRQLMEKQRSAT